jgi:hypothetical protein
VNSLYPFNNQVLTCVCGETRDAPHHTRCPGTGFELIRLAQI